MPRFCIFLLVLTCTASLQGGSPTPSKDPEIEAERLVHKPGTPLSTRTLVSNPAPLKGLLSWSLETKIHRGRFHTSAVSPDGKLIATGGLDSTLRIWDLASGKLLRAIISLDGYAYGLSFSPGGRYIASGSSQDGAVRVWEASTGKFIKHYKGHPTAVTQTAWSRDGKWLVGSGGGSGYISTWETETALLRGKASLGRPVLGLTLHPDSLLFAAVTNDSAIVVVDIATGKTDRTVGESSDNYVTLAWSPSGKQLAAGTAKYIFLFNYPGIDVALKIEGAAPQLNWNAKGNELSACNPAERLIRVWNPSSGELIHKVPAYATWYGYMPEQTHFVYTDSIGFGTIALADPKQTMFREVTGVAPPVWASGRPVLTGLGTAVLTLWDPSTGKLLRKLEGSKAYVTAHAWSPDGKTLAAGDADRSIRLWDVDEGKVLKTLTQHKAPVTSIAWTPDGKELATGARDKSAIVWNAKSGEVIQTLSPLQADVTSLTWSPTGNTLALGVSDGNAFLYSRTTWKPSKALTAPKLTAVTALAFPADAKTLIGGDAYGVTPIWSIATGKKVSELPRGGAVTSLSFFAKSDLLLTGRSIYAAEIYSMTTGKRLHVLPVFSSVTNVAWSLPGPLVAVSSADRTCRFFEAFTGKLKGHLIAEADQLIGVSIDGHYRGDGDTDQLFYVVQNERGQEIVTPAEFATKYSWKNDPTRARFTAK